MKAIYYVVLSTTLFLLGTPSYATELVVLPDVVQDIINHETTGSLDTINILNQEYNRLQNRIIQDYDGLLLFNRYGLSEQEELSQSIDQVSQELCRQKEHIIDQYTGEYYMPSRRVLKNKNISFLEGNCYNDHMLLHQEGVQSYVIDGVATLQTIPITLLQQLGYSEQGFIDYLYSDTLQIEHTDDFFFRRKAEDGGFFILGEIYDDKIDKLLMKHFDHYRILLITQVDDYPFLSPEVSIALLGQQGDHLIAITSPYGALYHSGLGNVMQLLKGMFTQSVIDTINDTVLSSQYFDQYYDMIREEYSIDNTLRTKNLVHYYLTILRQYDSQPNIFLEKITDLIQQDFAFKVQAFDVLQTLALFLK